MKTITFILLAASLCIAQNTIPVVSNKCVSAAPPYLTVEWQGPLFGKTCTINAKLYGHLHNCDSQGCHTWSCISGVTEPILEDYTVLPGESCDCYDDWTAAKTITVDDYCTPTGSQFNENYFCD